MDTILIRTKHSNHTEYTLNAIDVLQKLQLRDKASDWDVPQCGALPFI